eukprot:199750_1
MAGRMVSIPSSPRFWDSSHSTHSASTPRGRRGRESKSRKKERMWERRLKATTPSSTLSPSRSSAYSSFSMLTSSRPSTPRARRDRPGTPSSRRDGRMTPVSRRDRPGTPTGRRSAKRDSNKYTNVVIRIRPPLPRELDSVRKFSKCTAVSNDHHSITVNDSFPSDDSDVYTKHSYTFDYVYDLDSTQSQVYDNTARDAVISTLQGYNATIIAYGQTGSGKTYTMEGFDSERERGIIPRAIEEIFDHIYKTAGPAMRFLVRCSYLQIYQEVIYDLLKPERDNLTIRENPEKGLYVEGLSEWVVRSPQEIYGLIKRGSMERATSNTKLNDISSRSHAIFIIIVEQNEITIEQDD